jgi:hypothetical protein
MLARSGINLERAASRGYETITDKARLVEIGITPAGRRVPGLLVPLRDVRGSVWGHQFRPDTPRMTDGGRLVKYETPTGQHNGLDIPPGVGPQLGDPATPLWVTEGSKKADCAAAHELCCVSLSGVWNWRGTNDLGGKVALPDWDDVALNGRQVVIAYDGDVTSKDTVRAAMLALGCYLARRGAHVSYLHLPDEEDKVGLDDYLMDHSVGDLWALVSPVSPGVARGGATAQQAKPKPPPPFGSIDGAVLLDDIRTWFTRFICVVDSGDYDILSLWAVHTHLARELYTTPRLLITSPIHESGKTTLLEHLQRLCLRPIQAAVISSEALLPRLLEQSLRTVLLDEAHRSLRSDKPGVEDLLSIINTGYRWGATRPVLMSKGNGEWESREMSTFAPVAMAGNTPNLPDDTMSRTLRILMYPDMEDLSEETDWEFIEPEACELAARIADWADSVRTVIKQTVVDLPQGCTRRARERWRPLKRIAELAGGGWPDITDVLIKANLAEEEAEREDGLRARPPGMTLLADLYAVWPEDEGEDGNTEEDEDKKVVATSELVRRLIAHNPDYWGPDSPYGKKLTPQRFGRLLSGATKVTTVRPGGGGSPRGYLRSQLETVWRRLGMFRDEKTQEDDPPPNQTGRTGQSGQTGRQGPDPTDVTGSTGSTGLREEVPHNAELLCCWRCGAELTADEPVDDITDGDYCRDCADELLAQEEAGNG